MSVRLEYSENIRDAEIMKRKDAELDLGKTLKELTVVRRELHDTIKERARDAALLNRVLGPTI